MKRQFVQIKPSRETNPSAQPDFERAVAEEYPQGGSVQGASPLQEPPSLATMGQGLLSSWTKGDLQSRQQEGNQSNRPHTVIPPNAQKPITDPLNPFGNAPRQAQQHISTSSGTPFASLHGGPAILRQEAPSAFGSGIPNAQPFNPPLPAGIGWSMNGVSQPPMSMPQGVPPQPMPMGRPPQQPAMNPMGPPPMAMNRAPTMAPPLQSVGAPPGYLNIPTSPNSSDYMVNPVAPAQRRNTGQLNNPNLINMAGRPGDPNNRSQITPPKKRQRVPVWARVALGVMTVLLVLAGGSFWYYQTNYADFVGTSTGQLAIHHQIKDEGGNTAQVNQNTADSGATLSGGRINILLLGSDTDGKYNDSNGILQGTPLAQTDIIVTIDPQTKQVGMLSIPRDLQVTQSNTGGEYKLDEVFMHGVSGKAIGERVGNAAGLTEDTILYNYGIHIDYYAWVSLQGFVKVIDTAGGVDIDAIHPMVDDNYPFDIGNNTGDSYAYERLYISPGPQHMNGPQALNYVRTRHSDLVGDFGRSARQQQILSDLKLKLATPGIIGELPQLIKDLNGSVVTDMQLNTILELANYARTVDTAKIQRVTLGPPYAVASQHGTNSNYYPNCPAIQAEIAQMFDLGNKANCIPQTDNPTAALIAPPTAPQRAASLNTTSAHRSEGPTVSQASANDAVSTLVPANSLSAYQSLNPETGIHSMLDLMFAVVFESFDGLKV